MRSFKSRNNLLYSWWWSIDRITLTAIMIMMGFSAFMVATASPAVAERIGLEPFYFIERQIVYLAFALIIIFVTSLFSIDNIKKLAAVGFSSIFIMLIITLIAGTEIKGAKRWINLPGFSLQPSEFMKPFFALITAWLLSLKYKNPKFPAFTISTAIFIIVASLIISQPDFGMTITLTLIWGGQLFLGGLSLFWVVSGIVFVGCAGMLGYLFLPHVAKRIDNFLYPEATENYQVTRSIEAFLSGGIYGKGPGEGIVKQVIPDSHTDFIFAVVGEELGLITCLLILSLYSFVVLRGFYRILQETNMFVVFAVAGILIQFGFQAMVNIGVTINLLPTKGMTLPFISYGGSSMIAISLAIGMMLALTKRRFYSHSYRTKYKRSLYQERELV